MGTRTARCLVLTLCAGLSLATRASTESLPPAPWPSTKLESLAVEAAPPPGPAESQPVFRVDYYWHEVSGLTSVSATHPRHGMLVGNVMGPESVLLSPMLQSLPIRCPGGTNTAATAMNAQAAIAGFCSTRHSEIIGFLRTPNGRYIDVRVPRATLTEATAVNNHEHVGGDYRAADGIYRGFIWTGGRSYASIEVTSGTGTALMGLNNDQEAVGFYFPASQPGTAQGWLLRRRILYAVTVPGSVHTMPVHINDADEVTGNYVTTGGEMRSFVLTARGYEDIAVPDATITDVAGMDRGVYWGRYLVPGDTETMPWLSYGFIARLVPQPLPPPPPVGAFRASMAPPGPSPLALALCDKTGGPGTITPGKLLGRQIGCQ